MNEDEQQADYLGEYDGSPMKVVVRFRIGSENLSSKIWKSENEMKCRTCEKET